MDQILFGVEISFRSLGAKPKLGFGETLNPSELDSLGLTESPEQRSPSSSTRFVRPAHSQIPLFRRKHVSAFNLCMSLFR
jgi:hypothetical protein